MPPERWRRIDALYHQALEHETDERPTFLDQACGSDSFLRQEVESLLEAHDRGGNFLSAAAGPFVMSETSMTGQTISHYRILEKLGFRNRVMVGLINVASDLCVLGVLGGSNLTVL